MARSKPTPTPAQFTLQTPAQIDVLATQYSADDWQPVPGERVRGLRWLKNDHSIVISRRQYSKHYSEDTRIYRFGLKEDSLWYGRYFKSRGNLTKYMSSLPDNHVIWITAYGRTNYGKSGDYDDIGWYTILPPKRADEAYSITHDTQKKKVINTPLMDTNETRIFAQILSSPYPPRLDPKQTKRASYLIRWKAR